MKKPVDKDASIDDAAFKLEEFLPYRLAVAADSVTRVIARHHLQSSGLNMPEWRLMAAVGRFGVLSPNVAGQRTAMDKVKVSRAAASLVARGLLRQAHDPNDGRGRLLRLTRKGSNVYATIGSTALRIEEALMPCLTATEWRGLHRSLGKLSAHAMLILQNASDTEDC